jgi:hypothetical protein
MWKWAELPTVDNRSSGVALAHSDHPVPADASTSDIPRHRGQHGGTSSHTGPYRPGSGSAGDARRSRSRSPRATAGRQLVDDECDEHLGFQCANRVVGTSASSDGDPARYQCANRVGRGDARHRLGGGGLGGSAGEPSDHGLGGTPLLSARVEVERALYSGAMAYTFRGIDEDTEGGLRRYADQVCCTCERPAYCTDDGIIRWLHKCTIADCPDYFHVRCGTFRPDRMTCRCHREPLELTEHQQVDYNAARAPQKGSGKI